MGTPSRVRLIVENIVRFRFCYIVKNLFFELAISIMTYCPKELSFLIPDSAVLAFRICRECMEMTRKRQIDADLCPKLRPFDGHYWLKSDRIPNVGIVSVFGQCGAPHKRKRPDGSYEPSGRLISNLG